MHPVGSFCAAFSAADVYVESRTGPGCNADLDGALPILQSGFRIQIERGRCWGLADGWKLCGIVKKIRSESRAPQSAPVHYYSQDRLIIAWG